MCGGGVSTCAVVASGPLNAFFRPFSSAEELLMHSGGERQVDGLRIRGAAAFRNYAQFWGSSLLGLRDGSFAEWVCDFVFAVFLTFGQGPGDGFVASFHCDGH